MPRLARSWAVSKLNKQKNSCFTWLYRRNASKPFTIALHPDRTAQGQSQGDVAARLRREQRKDQGTHRPVRLDRRPLEKPSESSAAQAVANGSLSSSHMFCLQRRRIRSQGTSARGRCSTLSKCYRDCTGSPRRAPDRGASLKNWLLLRGRGGDRLGGAGRSRTRCVW